MSLLIPTFRISLRQSMRFLPKTIRATGVFHFHDINKLKYSNPESIIRIPWKNYCSKSNLGEVTIAYYDEIKSLPDHPEKLLIDVREPEELKQTGKIPTSINIPLDEVQNALSDIDQYTFEKLYGVSKPSQDQNIIFYCMIGKRSHKASEIALKLGYKNVKNYLGSWTEWAECERN